MSDAPLDTPLTRRYVAGFAPGSPASGSVHLIVEDAKGAVVARAIVIDELDQEQLDHLHMQLGKLLVIMGKVEVSDLEVEAAAEAMWREQTDDPTASWYDQGATLQGAYRLNAVRALRAAARVRSGL